MPDDWDDTFELGGLTLGPEERLEREIAKSKALKVERLQLRDRIARLEEENARLKKQLEARDASPPVPPPTSAQSSPAVSNGQGRSRRVTIGLLVFFAVAGFLCLRWLSG